MIKLCFSLTLVFKILESGSWFSFIYTKSAENPVMNLGTNTFSTMLSRSSRWMSYVILKMSSLKELHSENMLAEFSICLCNSLGSQISVQNFLLRLLIIMIWFLKPYYVLNFCLIISYFVLRFLLLENNLVGIAPDLFSGLNREH